MSQNQTHTITIKAVDGSSQVFRVMGQSAQAAAVQIGASGKAAAGGLAQVDAAAVKTRGSLATLATQAKSFSQTNAALGATAVALAGILSDAARSAAEEQAGLERLEQAVNNTGASFDRLAVPMDAAVKSAMALSFADEQAVNALNTLTSTTGDAAGSIDLLGLAMDLARGKGIDLATASQIIGKVAAGNTTVLQRYGIILDENATSQEALAAIQQRFAGQAETYAATQAGAAAKIRNAFDDMLESIAANTGPAQTLLLLLPGLSSGFTLAAGAVSGFSGMAARAIPAALGLTAALGPLALLLAGGAALGFLAVKINDARLAADEAKDPLDSLTDTLVRLRQEAESTAEAFALDSLIRDWQAVSAAGTQMASDLAAATDEISRVGTPGDNAFATEEMQQSAVAVTAAMEKQRDAIDDVALSADQLRQLEIDLNVVLAQEDDQRRANLATLRELYQEYLSGQAIVADATQRLKDHTITQDDFDRAMQGVTLTASELTDGVHELTGAHAGLGKVVGGSIGTYELFNRQLEVASRGLLDLAGGYGVANQAANDAAEAQRNLSRAIAEGKGFGTQGLTSLSQSPSQVANNAAGLADVSARRAVQRSDDAKRAAEDLKRTQEQGARDAAAAQADLQRATEEAASAGERSAEAQEHAAELAKDHAADLRTIERQRIGETRRAETALAQDLKGLQQERVANERAALQELRQLEGERRQIAVETEQQLADLAQQRQEVQAAAGQQIQDAEQKWLETSRENLAKQAELRDELRRTTAEASAAWNQLNADNLAQQRAIREELQRTIRDLNFEFGRTKSDLKSDLAQAQQDLANAQGAGGGPFDAAGVAAAKQKIQDIQLALSRATEDRQRAEKDARRESADQEKALQEERARAEAAFESQVRDARAETASQIQDLEAQRMAALKDRQAAEQTANANAASQLAALAAEERGIMDEQAKKFAEIEAEKLIVARDAAREQQTLARETQKIQETSQRAVAKIQAEAVNAARKSEAAYREEATDAAKAVAEAQEQLKDALDQVTERYDEIRGGAQGRVSVQTAAAQAALNKLKIQLEELEREYTVRVILEEAPDPLDGPPPKGRITNGALGLHVRPEMRIPGAALGRVIRVGEVGPETLVAPHGTMVIPDGGARGRAAQRGGGPQYIFQGNVTFLLRSADIAREIDRQVNTARRG